MKSHEVEFTRRATADFDEALLWYRERSDEAAGKWIAAVERSLDILEQHPQKTACAARRFMSAPSARDDDSRTA